MMIESLEWRYATKKFDPAKKLDTEQLDYLKEAIRLSVSSYGLQMYNVLIVSDPKTKEILRPMAWDQPQITNCSHLFIFCNPIEYKDEFVDDYIDQVVKEQEVELSTMEDYREFIKKKVGEKSKIELNAWMQRQPYLAIANLIIACAEQRIDACPLEGFEPQLINKQLLLNEKNLNALAIVSVGFRAKDDPAQYRKKIRKSKEELFIDL